MISPRPSSLFVSGVSGAALGALLLLAACGKNAASPTTAAALGGGPRWNADDACKTLDRQAVADAVGQPVKDVTSLPAGSADNGVRVASCSYDLGGPVVAVMTRVSKDDLSDKEIEEMRTGGGMLPPGEAAPGLGMRAYWSDKAHQLQLWADRRHYAGIAYAPAMTLPGTPPPAGPDPKAVAVALARKLVG